MQLFTRIVLLAVFATGGAGLAIYIAQSGPLQFTTVASLNAEPDKSGAALAADGPAASATLATPPSKPAAEKAPAVNDALEATPTTVSPITSAPVAPAPVATAPEKSAASLPAAIAPLSAAPAVRAPAALPQAVSELAGDAASAVVSRMKDLENKLDQMREDSRRREQADARRRELAALERRIQDNEREARAARQLTEERWAQLRGPAPLALPAPAAQPQLPPPATLPAPPAPRAEPSAVASNSSGGLTIRIKNGEIRKVLEDLGRHAGLNLLISDKVTGTVSASLTDVDLEQALEAVLHSTGYEARTLNGFTYIGSPAELNAMETSRERLTTRVYRPDYVTAIELNTLIAPLLTESIGKSTITTSAENGIPASSTETGGDKYAGNEVLLVHDYPSVLLQIDEVVKRVDVRPRQVVIEAVILSVELNDSCELGIDFELLTGSNNARLVSGAPLANLAQLQITPGQLSFGILDGDLGALVQALEQVGDTKVVAQPKLTCLNKQRAEILIGDQKGFVSTTQTETATTQTVEFLDVGTQLRIRPFISSDGIIRLEVHPELSTGEVRLVGNFALPEKSTTQVTTNVMCADGATIILGGLIREDTSSNTSQIPGLGSIPLFGPLFQKQKEEVTRSEIVVLITPRIVPDPACREPAGFSQQEFTQRKADTDRNNMHPLQHAKYSRRYFRLAQAAYNAKNYPAATNYVNISLEFWNDNPEALHLRQLLQYRVAREVMPVAHEAPLIEVPVDTGAAHIHAINNPPQGSPPQGSPPVLQEEFQHTIQPYYHQHTP